MMTVKQLKKELRDEQEARRKRGRRREAILHLKSGEKVQIKKPCSVINLFYTI